LQLAKKILLTTCLSLFFLAGCSTQPLVTSINSAQAAPKTVQTAKSIPAVDSPAPLPAAPVRYFFAGDTMFGRGISQIINTPEEKTKLKNQILEITKNAPLIVNLEGVIKDKCPPPRGIYDLCTTEADASEYIKDLNIIAVSIANNHQLDFGEEGLKNMKLFLRELGVKVLDRGDWFEFPEFYLAAFTDVDNYGKRYYANLEESDLATLDFMPTDKPRFVSLHWGIEYKIEPAERENEVQNLFWQKNIELIIGHHSHRAGNLACEENHCVAFSLGNFVFDQNFSNSSGKLLQIDFFPDGPYVLKLIDLPNYFAQFYPFRGT
jgi:poly-gamma-glutamate synthesis protein (capsule biosynthesis protein)